MDLDRFKEVNDTLGHHYGDLLLQQIGVRMKAGLRSSDTVARLGGDEFAVLLPETDSIGAISAAQAMLAAFEASFRVEGQNLDIGASVGIAAYPEHGHDAATLLRHADVAMYLAKRAHSGYAVYETTEDHNSSHRLALMSELRHALAEDQLLLYYQPLVNLADASLTGVEVLLRWPHPEHGFIPPDHFIPLAEHTGIIGPLTQWVLNEALRQCSDWIQSGLRLAIQVNLSMRSLHDISLPKTVAALLERHRVPAHYLTLEITESALMIDPGRALDVLTHLADIGADSKDAAIVRSVVAMAHAMGLEVVAEGVENPKAMGLLRSLTCDVAQGYHLSEPLPPDELQRWVASSPFGQESLSA
jgi:diguanylate cyclase (GGDEF)-like protein